MNDNNIPLAVRMRPQCLDDFVGQEHMVGQGKLLRRAIQTRRLPSLILWGPAGCGKTTMGLIIAAQFDAAFQHLNAAFSSVAEVKKIIITARERWKKEGKATLIFIDEIHRFNKLQQDSLIPDTESGNITLIGATIYTPSYYLIPSLVSRSLIAEFRPLTPEHVMTLLKRALQDTTRGLGALRIKITNKAFEYFARACSGDARKALTALEVAALSTPPDVHGEVVVSLSVAQESIQKNLFYDKKNRYHYDTISAFIKSMRGSDVDSSLYWLAKMIKGGEDPRFIARRLAILAAEDIGNANPFALVLATNAFKAVEAIGLPEASLVLAQITIYLASSPKSNASYMALSRAREDVEQEETQEVPEHIKTHAKDYTNPHSFGGHVKQDYGARRQYYFPKDVGEERFIKQFLAQLRAE